MVRRVMFVVCLAALSAIVFSSANAAAKFNKVIDVGQKAPEWKDLKGVDDKSHSLGNLKKAKLVVVTFTCNHCPIAGAYEERFNNFVRDYRDKGVEFVAISSSKEEQDGFEQMKEHAKEFKFTFPYLHDADQSVGRSFGATSTPQMFVIDGERKIAYMGAFDDNFIEAEVKHHYLVDAVDALLAGKKPEVAETRAKGCSIEYRKNGLKEKK